MHASTGYKERLHAAAAKALGMSIADLEAAFAEGRTLQYLAELEGADLNEVRLAMKRVHREQIHQAVEEGEISPEQADLLLKRFDLSPWPLRTRQSPRFSGG